MFNFYNGQTWFLFFGELDSSGSACPLLGEALKFKRIHVTCERNWEELTT